MEKSSRSFGGRASDAEEGAMTSSEGFLRKLDEGVTEGKAGLDGGTPGVAGAE
jgi:hypothetical protein